MAARKAPSGTSGVPVTRSGRQPSTIGTPRLRATSARCEPAAPVRAMTPRAANSSGASAGTGWSTSRIASPQSPGGRSCGRAGHQAGRRPRCPRPARHVLALAQHGGREQRHRRARGGQPARRGFPAHRGARFRGGLVRRPAGALGLQQPDPVVIGGPLDHVVAQQPPGPAGQSRHRGDHRLTDQPGEPVITGLGRRPRAAPRGCPLAQRREAPPLTRRERAPLTLRGEPTGPL